eukprot:scaffold10623_cov139-Isochrysis_galbana.AAC.3
MAQPSCRAPSPSPPVHTAPVVVVAPQLCCVTLCSQRCCSQLDNGFGVLALEGNLVDAGEEREVGLELLVLEHGHDVLGGDGALQLLAVELRLLNVIPRSLALCKGLGARAVAACGQRGKAGMGGRLRNQEARSTRTAPWLPQPCAWLLRDVPKTAHAPHARGCAGGTSRSPQWSSARARRSNAVTATKST